MARYSINGEILTDIAEVIRDKKYGEGWKQELTDVEISHSSAKIISTKIFEKTKITITNISITESLVEGAECMYIRPTTPAGTYETITLNFNGTTFPVSYEFNTPIASIDFSARYFHGLMDLVIEPGIDVSVKPVDMSNEIEALSTLPPEAFSPLTGNLQYRFAYNTFNWFIEGFGDKITTDKISTADYMFQNSDLLTEIPFEINLIAQANSSYAFDTCSALITAPKINFVDNKAGYYFMNMFQYCKRLKSFPEDYAADWDFSYIDSQTSQYNGRQQNMFLNCYSLLNIPTPLINHCNPYGSTTYSLYNGSFSNCYNIGEIKGLAVYDKANWTSNGFSSTFYKCERLRDITFKTQADGSPYVCNGWARQAINLSTTGFGYNCKIYNDDITEENNVNGKLDMYLSYINNDGANPNAYADAVEDSFYNRKSAVRTFATLPDVSGNATGGNTITLSRAAAYNFGDEYWMYKLSEEEIAVAAAKGWTVTFF